MSIILSGVAVFLVGEILVRFFLGPLHGFKEVKGEIASTLLFHANNYGQHYVSLLDAISEPDLDERTIHERIESAKMWNNDLSKASDETRLMASKLISAAEGIPFYKFLSNTGAVPSKGEILKAKENLIWLSNSFRPNQNQFEDCRSKSAEICRLLSIHFFRE